MSQAALSQAFLELAPDAMVVTDAAGQILLVNYQTEVLFGCSRSDLLGQPVEALLPPRFHRPHERHRADYTALPHTRPMGTGLALFGRRRDGSEFPIEVSLSPVQTSDGLLVMGVIRDITDRKRLEAAEHAAHAAAEAQRTLLQTVLDASPGGIYLVRGPDAELVMANRAAIAVWGTAWPQGQPMDAFLRTSGVRFFSETGQPLELTDLATLQVLRSGQPVHQRREVVRRRDGTRLPILLSAVPIDPTLLASSVPQRETPQPPDTSVSQGTTPLSPGFAKPPSATSAALVHLQDVSLVQEAEQLKDEFISIAAHELRNPMAAIQGFASMLRAQTAAGHGPVLADWQQEAIAELESAALRLNELTSDLLDVTRIQAGRLQLHPTPQELVALVRRCIARVQQTTAAHALTLEAPAEPVLLEVDGLRLEQVFTNLLGNAIKYSPSGGPVHIAIRADREAGLAEVRIRDFGIGIPADQQARLFQRFARAANVHDYSIPGTGLGLYVSRELVERHGGHLWFESVEGEGTTFFLTLPLALAVNDTPATTEDQSGEDRPEDIA